MKVLNREAIQVGHEISRRWFLKAMGTAGVTVAAGSLLQACGTSKSSTPAPSPAPGTGGSSAPAATKKLAFGVVTGITGAHAEYSRKLKLGYDLWADLVNTKGGITVGNTKYTVDLRYLDGKSDTTTTVRLVEKLVTEDGVKTFFGPFGSLVVKAIQPALTRLQVPMLASYAYLDSVYELGNEWVFEAMPPSSIQLSGCFDLAKTVDNPKIQTVAYIGPNDELGVTIGQDTEREAKRVGFRMVSNQLFPPGTKDYAPMLRAIGDAKPDMVVVNGYVQDFIPLAKQMQSMGITAPFLCYENNSGLVEAVGDGANGIVTPVPWDEAAAVTKDEYFGDTKAFMEAYKKKYSEPMPDFVPALAAHNGVVYAKALAKAGTVDDGTKIRDAFKSLDTETFFGKVKFDKRGMNTAGNFPVVQIQNKQQKLVWPTGSAAVKAVHPYPSWKKA